MKEFRRDNHFVPKLYLKKWGSEGLKVWGYRTLVSQENIPLWKLQSIRGVAYHKNLYTRFSADGETDEFELWFEKEFETPAEEALYKATSNLRLSAEDWRRLIRFAAAQSVRTPARLIKELERWRNDMPELLNSTLRDIVQGLGDAKHIRDLPKPINTNDEMIFPLRIKREPSDNPDFSLFKVETIVGRSLWLFGIKHILTNTIKVLLQHKWSILHVAPSVKWITSDDPVICLNYYEKEHYDFGGGWGFKGSEIIFPLSPKHILYTRVGYKNGSRMDASYELSMDLQRIIAEHSHRWIFAKEPINDIEELRARVIDKDAYRKEMEAWEQWHDDQSTAELKITRYKHELKYTGM